MTQVESDKITEPTLKLCWNTFAIRRAAEVLRAANLQLMAEDVEAQLALLAPGVKEPTAFGSIVRARHSAGPDGSDACSWQRDPARGAHYWMSEFGVVEVWSELTDVEVLRVGLGEPTPQTDAGAASPPADRTGAATPAAAESATAKAAPASSTSHEPSESFADQVVRMSKLAHEANKDAFDAGFDACRAGAHQKIRALLAEAITSERKNAFEKAIQAVEELAP